MDDSFPRFSERPFYQPYARNQVSDNPSLDCLAHNHMWVENVEPGAFPTSDGEPPRASWCLWCDGGVSNEGT
jgi:hypothetical protein